MIELINSYDLSFCIKVFLAIMVALRTLEIGKLYLTKDAEWCSIINERRK